MEHSLTTLWRPTTMMTILGLVVLDSFDLLPNPLPDEVWAFVIGAYAVGRSGEKIAKVMRGNQ